MKRFNRYVGSRDAALEERPEILKSIRVYAAIYVLNGMIDNLMRVIRRQSFVGKQGIRVQSRASRDMLANLRLQFMFLAVRYDGGANLPAAFQDSHDCGLVFGACASDSALTFGDVHVSRLATDERFIYFDFHATTAELRPEEIVLHDLADSLEHEPCRLLMNPQRLPEFVTADAVLAVAKHPKRRHPFVKSDGRILHDRADLQGELLLAGVAEPDAPGLDERVFRRIAARTRHLTVRPTQFGCVGKAAVMIGEVNDGIL